MLVHNIAVWVLLLLFHGFPKRVQLLWFNNPGVVYEPITDLKEIVTESYSTTSYWVQF